MGKEQELLALLAAAEKWLMTSRLPGHEVAAINTATAIQMAREIISRRSSSDEQAEVVGWRAVTSEGRVLFFDRDAQPVEPSWKITTLYASPPAVAAGGVTEARVEAAAREIYALDVYGSVAGGDVAWDDLDSGRHHEGAEHKATCIAQARAALTAALAVGDEGIREGAKDTVDYVMQYGGRCRDCADENGTCPHSGLPCDTDASRKAIGFVLRAVDYGERHGYLQAKDTTNAE